MGCGLRIYKSPVPSHTHEFFAMEELDHPKLASSFVIKSQDCLCFAKLSDQARPPERNFESAGYDLRSIISADIPPQASAPIATGLAVQMPMGTYGRIAPRSGLAFRHNIAVGAGVIDADYRGEVVVLMINQDRSNYFRVKPGDKIAQLICERYVTPPVVELAKLDDTPRGSKGFGSSGLQ